MVGIDFEVVFLAEFLDGIDMLFELLGDLGGPVEVGIRFRVFLLEFLVVLPVDYFEHGLDRHGVFFQFGSAELLFSPIFDFAVLAVHDKVGIPRLVASVDGNTHLHLLVIGCADKPVRAQGEGEVDVLAVVVHPVCDEGLGIAAQVVPDYGGDKVAEVVQLLRLDDVVLREIVEKCAKIVHCCLLG